MRRTFLFALPILVTCLGTPQAYGQAHGSISWTGANPVTANQGNISASGTFTVGVGWTGAGILLLAANPNGGLVHKGPANIAIDGSSWNGSVANVPNGNYYVWVILTIQNTMTAAKEYITASIQTGVQMTNSNVQAPTLGGSITWGANQPQRNQGTISGSGTYALNQGWALVAPDPISLQALPNSGGLIYLQTIANPQGGNWSATIANVPAGDYKVMVVMGIEKTGEDPQDLTASIVQK